AARHFQWHGDRRGGGAELGHDAAAERGVCPDRGLAVPPDALPGAGGGDAERGVRTMAETIAGRPAPAADVMTRLRLNARLFWEGALLSYIALFRWLKPSTYLASKVFMPVTYILFFTFIGVYATGWENASFYVVGNAIQIAAVSGIYGVTMSIGG